MAQAQPSSPDPVALCTPFASRADATVSRPLPHPRRGGRPVAGGICLGCRAVPITNVVIELQEGDKLRRVLPLGFASGFVAKL
jgi:hypothetical protein